MFFLPYLFIYNVLSKIGGSFTEKFIVKMFVFLGCPLKLMTLMMQHIFWQLKKSQNKFLILKFKFTFIILVKMDRGKITDCRS